VKALSAGSRRRAREDLTPPGEGSEVGAYPEEPVGAPCFRTGEPVRVLGSGVYTRTAQQWAGYGTALKLAWIAILARKPLRQW
jgi:hypothetical protein